MPFQHPTSPHTRRHGPRGYTRYKAYKPWLRDEFSFRCVYCLVRETWYPEGRDNFSVDHQQPQLVAPELAFVYENLVYACIACNRNKGTRRTIPDPCLTAFANHLQIQPDGRYRALTPEGERLRRYLKLNSPNRVAFRRNLLALLTELRSRPDHENDPVYRQWMGYPADMPNLARLSPPGGNSKPGGILESYFERRKRHELDSTL